jgi:hypothetical protein
MATGHAYFRIEPARGGWQAKFYGGNDELVWITEIHPDRRNALAAIQFAKNYAAIAPVKP